MIAANIERFFATAVERYLIMRRKEAGERELTKDKIFQEWRFCNTFREDDKTTRWFRTMVRDPLRGRPAEVISATVAFRWFNRIETGEKILPLLHNWGPTASQQARELLKDQRPVVTGAYIIKTPDGMNKLDGVLTCIDRVARDAEHLAAHLEPGETTCEGFWTVLQEYPYLGGFMAYQVVSDLIHTCVLRLAPDRATWAFPGPGCARGLGWLVDNNPDLFSRTSKKDVATMQVLMQALLRRTLNRDYWPPSWRIWEMQSIQHWCCEYDKYTRAMNGQPQKRRYA